MGPRHVKDSETHSLGVLFVHGMGSHPQGSTLREFGDPLIDWLEHGNVGVKPVVTTARLTPGDEEPAHVACALYRAASAPETRSPDAPVPLGKWLLAESCWSESFKPPTYPRMAFWLIAAVPWMVGEYVRGASKREWGRKTHRYVWIVRWPLMVLYALVGALLSGPLVAALTVLLFVRVIPIKQVKNAIDKVVRVLAESLGDVYVILTTHVDRAAIRHRIVRDHKWLSARCTHTVVVAHSAGSALTHQLIRDGRISDLSAYVTLGEAIWRMRWMVKLSQMGALRMLALALAVAGTGLLITGALGFFGVVRLSSRCTIVLSVGGLVLHIVSALVVWKRAVTTEWRREAIDVLAGKVAPWRDYVASSDPVPAGALTEFPHDTAPNRRRPGAAPKASASHYQPVGLRNRRSMALDHTTYVSNVEGFIAGLASDLARADGFELNITSCRLERARTGRAWRTLSRALARFASGAVAALVMLALIRTPGAFEEVGSRLPWLSDAAKALLPERFHQEVRTGRTGLLGALVLSVTPWLATGMGLRIWDRIDTRRFHEQRPPAPHPVPHIALALLWLACTAPASFGVLALADVDARGWWIAVGVGLLLGSLLLGAVKAVAEYRDRVYS